MRVRRRDLVAALAVVPASLLPLTAKQASTPPPSAPDRLQKNLASLRETSAKLSQMSIPIELEPAFLFRP